MRPKSNLGDTPVAAKKPLQYDLTGLKIGRLSVLSFAGMIRGHANWNCVCECGKSVVKPGSGLRRKLVRSCGCLHRESSKIRGHLNAKHGMATSITYNSWSGMKQRTLQPNNQFYHRYGGVGKGVCKFISSSVVNLVSLIGQRPAGTSLDRIDGNFGYTCGNCPECIQKGWKLNVRWSTCLIQSRNRYCVRTLSLNGETRNVPEWGSLLRVPARIINSWMREQWSEKRIINILCTRYDIRMRKTHGFMNTLNTYFDKIYCINLARRTDRWANVERQCKKFGITLERFEAFDGLVDHTGKVSGNFGCTSSHRAVLDLICGHGFEKTLILEDDFEIVHEEFCEMFDAMIQEVPDAWELLYLGAGYAEDPIERVNSSVIRAGRLLTTSSYAITYAMARKIAPHVSGIGPIDSLYGGWQREAKTYVFSPRLMVQADGVSDLTGQFSRNSNSMLDTAHENRLDGTHLER